MARPVCVMNGVICLPLFKLNFYMFSEGDMSFVCLVFGIFEYIFASHLQHNLSIV